MVREDDLIEAIVISLMRTAKGRLVEAVEAVICQKYESSVKDGQTVISTSELGGSTTLVLPQGLSPGEILGLFVRTRRFLLSQADPNNPVLSTWEIQRLRASFATTL